MMSSNIVPRDQLVRNEILNNNGNTVVLANAGSGKTTILSKKVMKDIDNISNKVAVMTFTNKAVREIESKIQGNDLDKKKIDKIQINTIDGFVEKEIIGEFIRSVYKDVEDYKYYYDGENSINNYIEGMERIKKYSKFGTYKFKEQKKGNNFKFEVALNILKNSITAREYLRYTYTKIYVDEYQDSDLAMHHFFLYLRDSLKIELFVVGDDKQSVYQWRGARPQNIRELYEDGESKTYILSENFRSEKQIVDFSNSLNGFFASNYINENRIIFGKDYMNIPKYEIIHKMIEKNMIDLNKTTMILLKTNSEIKKLYDGLNNKYPNVFSYIPTTNINNCPNSTIMMAIGRYYFFKNYSEYDFREDCIDNVPVKELKGLKKLLDKVVVSLTTSNINNIYEYINIAVDSYNGRLESDILYETLVDTNNKSIFLNQNDEKNLISTVFTAKGLEAEQVVFFSSDCIDNYSGKLSSENNYVAITRAKSKLFIFDDIGTYETLIKNEIYAKNNNNYFSNMVDYISKENLFSEM